MYKWSYLGRFAIHGSSSVGPVHYLEITIDILYAFLGDIQVLGYYPKTILPPSLVLSGAKNCQRFYYLSHVLFDMGKWGDARPNKETSRRVWYGGCGNIESLLQQW